jgi:hypothetical protein
MGWVGYGLAGYSLRVCWVGVGWAGLRLDLSCAGHGLRWDR